MQEKCLPETHFGSAIERKLFHTATYNTCLRVINTPGYYKGEAVTLSWNNKSVISWLLWASNHIPRVEAGRRSSLQCRTDPAQKPGRNLVWNLATGSTRDTRSKLILATWRRGFRGQWVTVGVKVRGHRILRCFRGRRVCWNIHICSWQVLL